MTSGYPKLRSIHSFISVFEEGTITGASKAINVSQPALTQSILKLEKRLNVSLFYRQKRMQPTDVGRKFYDRVKFGVRHLQSATCQCTSKLKNVNPNIYRQISSSQLNALLMVFEMGSFQLAAKELRIALSTAHRSFRSLESLLGVQLAQTSAHSVRPNADGQRFYTLAKLATREFRQAIDDIDGWKGTFNESFTIGALPLAQASIINKALSAFCHEYPQVSVCVVDGTYDSMVRQMERGEIDYIIGALREDWQHDTVDQVPLFDDPLILVARAQHPLSKQKKIKKIDLATYPWIAPRKGAPSRDYFDQFYKGLNRSDTLQQPIETGTHSVLRGLLLDSDRLALISEQQADFELKHGILLKLGFPLVDSSRTIGYAQRKGWHPSIPQERFLDLLKRCSDRHF